MVFFFAALAEVQVTVLSVLNLPRQGLPLVQLGTVVFAARCFFASEILCDSPAYLKQRMNKKSLAVLPGNPKCTMTCIWRLYYLFMACCYLGNCGYQTDRKIYYQCEIAVRLRTSRNPRAARATKLSTRFARVII